jgi:hypothetical protein
MISRKGRACGGRPRNANRAIALSNARRLLTRRGRALLPSKISERVDPRRDNSARIVVFHRLQSLRVQRKGSNDVADLVFVSQTGDSSQTRCPSGRVHRVHRQAHPSQSFVTSQRIPAPPPKPRMTDFALSSSSSDEPPPKKSWTRPGVPSKPNAEEKMGRLGSKCRRNDAGRFEP